MRFLVVRVGRVGDMVMITPALRALLDRHPQAEIDLLTSPDGRRVLQGFDARITNIIIYQRSGLFASHSRRRVAAHIRERSYDRIYCFELGETYYRLFEGIGAPVFGMQGTDPDKHYAARCVDCVNAAEDEPIQAGWLWLPVQAAARARARELLATEGIGPGTFVVGLHPTFSGARRRWWRRSEMARHKLWPAAHFGALARRLRDHARAQHMDLRVVMDLAPDERAFGQRIVEASDGAATLMTPPLDFERYKATLERYDLFVTPDTGPMHIAAAVGTRIVALFSGKRPEDCGPYVPADRFTVLRAEDTPHPERGLAAIEPDRVFEACMRHLPETRASG